MKNKNDTIDILLVAIGGYGRLYVQALQEPHAAGRVRIRGVVDPLAKASPEWPALQKAGIPRFDTIEEYLATGASAELAIISSPIAFHADQACAALEAGMNVLCEKPLTARVADAQRMIAARDASGKFLEIGYQWSFSQPIQKLKTDILAGDFGTPRTFRTWVAWPRDSSYYGRNKWAGRIRDDAGNWVYDSPANNATAHFLHNMLYLLGPRIDRSATPTAITGECYRVNPIENFDAVCCRIETLENVDILFYSAHCVQKNMGPVSHFEFDNGTVKIQENGKTVAYFNDGRERSYGSPDHGSMRKLEHCIERCRAANGGQTLCGPEAAMPQTVCINGLQQMQVKTLNDPVVAQAMAGENAILKYVPGLHDNMRKACEQGMMFYEMSLPWARKARRVDLI